MPLLAPGDRAGRTLGNVVDTADPWAPVRWLMGRERLRLQGRSMTVLRLGSRERDLQHAGDWGPMGVY